MLEDKAKRGNPMTRKPGSGDCFVTLFLAMKD